MSNMNKVKQKAVEDRKNQLITKLLNVGLYKKYGKHLYEFSLQELEKEYLKQTKQKIISRT
ncbi:Fur-regulated basic protein FbpA [Priestia endophytica]|uniref:Fur-regulated basic protein FbpA n=1 Tax=Priestia endophytica TaxID=135735 RepID=UPI0030EDFFD2